MKKYLPTALLILTAFLLQATENVQISRVPGDLPVETGVFSEALVRDIGEEEEIYGVMNLAALDNYLYVLSIKPVGVFKLDLQGKTVARAGKRGEGPGEFVDAGPMAIYKKQIVVLAFMKKLLFFDGDLNYLKETRLLEFPMEMIINNRGEFILANSGMPRRETFFNVYSPEGKALRGFGDSGLKSGAGKKNYYYIFSAAYDPETGGIWAARGNCYDLLYFENEAFKAEIREKEGFFNEIEVWDKKEGRKRPHLTGRPIKILVVGKEIYYFYKKDDTLYCDIFNKRTYKLQRRIKLSRFYRRIVHIENKTFYALDYGLSGEEDNRLFRLQLKN